MKNRHHRTPTAADLFGGALFAAGLAASAAAADPIAVTDRLIDSGLYRPNLTAAGDLDGDGAADVVAGGPGSLQWYRNNGGAPTTFDPGSPFSYASTPKAVAIADIDHDGDNDVVFLGLGYLSYGSVQWLENDGLGGFSPPIEAGGSEMNNPLEAALVVADLDGDDDLDVVAVSRGPDAVFWLESDGAASPSFTYRELSTSIPGTGVDVCDLDGDGAQDIVVGAFNGNVVWFASDGAADPSFTQQLLGDIDNRRLSVACEDVDGDGDTDVCFGGSGGSTGVAGWLENDGGSPPAFARNNVSVSNQEVNHIVVGDFDGDGDLDLAGPVSGGSGGGAQNRVRWWENDGAADPSFAQHDLHDHTNASNARPSHMTAHDLDGDGDLDFAVVTENQEDLTWFENLTDPAPLITGQPEAQLVTAPTTVEMSVRASAAAFYQWQLDGEDLDDGGAFSGVNEATLTINATLTAEGFYRCVIVNDYGMLTSDTALLGVKAAPSACLGDINGDGRTDVFDFADFAADFGCETP